MTPLTRRDAMMLTAALAATAPALQPAAAQGPPKDDKDELNLLEVPSGVVGGSSIPVTIRIRRKDLVATNGSFPTAVTIALNVKYPVDPVKSGDTAYNDQVFKTKLSGIALAKDAAGKDTLPDIVVMTRLKMLKDPAKPPPAPGTSQPAAPAQAGGTNPPPAAAAPQFDTKLVVSVDPEYADSAIKNPRSGTKKITVKGEDCPPADVALLRLSLQPSSVKSGNGVLVRAVVPPARPPAEPSTAAPAPGAPAAPPPPRRLEVIECSVPGQQPPFRLSGINDDYLAQEVFVSFNLYPTLTEAGLVTMKWNYAPSSPDTNLTASAYLAVSSS